VSRFRGGRACYGAKVLLGKATAFFPIRRRWLKPARAFQKDAGPSRFGDRRPKGKGSSRQLKWSDSRLASDEEPSRHHRKFTSALFSCFANAPAARRLVVPPCPVLDQ